MSKTVVINIKSGAHYDVYIGRPNPKVPPEKEGSNGKWGCPFQVGKDGMRYDIIKKYREWILKQEELLDSLKELEGKRLGCWCKPLPCHGDVLVELIEKEKEKSA